MFNFESNLLGLSCVGNIHKHTYIILFFFFTVVTECMPYIPLHNGSDGYNDSNYNATDTKPLNWESSSHYRCSVENDVKMDGEISEESKLTACEDPCYCNSYRPKSATNIHNHAAHFNCQCETLLACAILSVVQYSISDSESRHI